MKIALAQMNTSMGAVESNLARMGAFLDLASKKGADLTIFPELSVIGYPPKDLLEQGGFVEDSWKALEKFVASRPKDCFLCGAVKESEKGRFNVAVLCRGGKIDFIQKKSLLPSYDVFDEVRYFSRSTEIQNFSLNEKIIGVTICEDIWADQVVGGRKLYNYDPAVQLAEEGADFLINISASPFHVEKEKLRRNLAQDLVGRIGIPLVYVNLVGGNDELLFDGGSFVMLPSGKYGAKAAVFEEELLLWDTESSEESKVEWPKEEIELMARGLEMGLSDYLEKCRIKKAIIGLSGGIDSAVVAALAVGALGPENVIGISMPSRFSSDGTRSDAALLAKNLGIEFHEISIESVFEGYLKTLQPFFSEVKPDATEENLQARIRGAILMAYSNKFGGLVISTGNKSELAVGYCTLYGDMVGGVSLIADVPKMKVYELGRFLCRDRAWIPESTFTRPPSAELSPNQKDQDLLPPYEILDRVLQLYIEDMQTSKDIVGHGFDRKTVDWILERVNRNEYKRRQAAPGIRVTYKAFGIGRRMPIARGPVRKKETG